ncbi:ATP-binding protein [Spiribacter onubensis]|uniref:ATP-binding protein n=1 Tax=Spiribacter onubensis TaxID=3122420 RepID=UPI0038B5A25A
MIPRDAKVTALELARGFPIVSFTGPRQSGKTTLARALFGDHAYVSLEDPEQREFATADPKGFLARFKAGLILDEVQRAPELFSWLQGVVDSERSMGRFVLTGSQEFGLRAGITQSLAGRVGLVHLLPLSLSELAGAGVVAGSLDMAMLQGGYPPIHDREVPPRLWFPNYVNTYLERDVPQLLEVRNREQFRRFVRLCAAHTGQLVNLSAIGADCGISHVTAREWLSVLEASYLVVRVPPYFRNFGKRLVKRPKLYFVDVGLAAWLLGIRDPETLNTHPLRGALFETLVVSEMLKERFNGGEPAELYFWRDHVGHEVDLVWERQGELHAMEIKSGATFAPDWLDGIDRWRRVTGGEEVKSTLVYGGDEVFVRDGVEVRSWRGVGQ